MSVLAANKSGSWQPRIVWGVASSPDAERWEGAYESREEAIELGRSDLDLDDDCPFWVIMGEFPDPATAFDVDAILELAGERACDNWNEVAAEDFPVVSRAARDELERLLRDWARQHVEPRGWQAVGEPEQIEPAGER